MAVDLVKDLYKEELKKKVDAWEGLEAEDFQYEPERAEMKAMMEKWLSEKLGITDPAKLKVANRKYFATCMAALVYETKVRPNLDDFIH